MLTPEPVVSARTPSQLTGGKLGHCFYASDGASAIEIALKMSFHYWRNTERPQKTQFVSLKGSYHGETLGALSVTDVALFKDTYAPLLRNSMQVQSPDWRLAEAGETPHGYATRCAQALERYLAAHHPATSAVILEPLVQGATGMAMYDAEYLRRVRELCDRFNVHLIADGVMTGFGRTGTFFAHEQAGITPDFLACRKGHRRLPPLSVVLTSDAVCDAFYDDDVTRGFLLRIVYGNALACRAALARWTFRGGRCDRGQPRYNCDDERAGGTLAHHERVRDFRNTGMIWAFEVDADGDGLGRASTRARKRELLLRPIGATVYFMPPIRSPKRSSQCSSIARWRSSKHCDGAPLVDARDRAVDRYGRRAAVPPPSRKRCSGRHPEAQRPVRAGRRQ